MILSDRIFDSKVEAGMPSLAAAPDNPDTLPWFAPGRLREGVTGVTGVAEWDAVAHQETAKSHRENGVRRFTQAALPDERLVLITAKALRDAQC